MVSPELKKLVAITQRHADADGEFHTAIPRLMLYRASAPTEHNAVVDVPSLCVIVQGAKIAELTATEEPAGRSGV